MNNFEELEAWKLARELRNEVSILVKKFPSDEKFKLIDQIIRSFRSVTANIAEGYGISLSGEYTILSISKRFNY